MSTCPVCGSPVEPDESACAACGFKLLGSTQSFRPIQMEVSSVAVDAAAQPKHARIRVTRGPQPEAVFRLSDRELSVGRSPQCDIFLNDMTVSRDHATICPLGNGYEVIDRNSFNGVWVNNASVERRLLKPGDVLQIGVFCLVYEEE